jgi:hypothetical protein
MVITCHFLQRLSQRGLSMRQTDLAMEFGRVNQDKFILDRKGAQSVIEKLDRLRKELVKIKDKGGVTVVYERGSLVTAYNCNRRRYENRKSVFQSY